MVNLQINGKSYTVQEGAKLIDVLDEQGIFVPRFCYHKSLGTDGNCRMCMVEIEGQKRPQISCDTYVKEGMKVHTDTPTVKELRKNILELELINHPIDCPICDQAGECKLQEYYMEEGLYDSELSTPKNKKSKAIDLGSNVILDQERCVLCIRCVRFCKDIIKTAELGVEKRADGARIRTFPGKKLDNPYAMNVVDLCPVGALTSKDFRFAKRVWFLKSTEGICQGCARGCNIYIDWHANKYESQMIYRFRPRHNHEVNGYFMCDEGRLSYKKENRPIEKNTLDMSELKNYLKSHKSKILFLVSPECSLEEMYAIQSASKEFNAFVSGYSDGYIDDSFGDDFLRCSDKSPNRKGFEYFGIDQSKEYFENALKQSVVLVSFLHKDAAKLAQDTLWINLSTDSLGAKYFINIASFSKKTGHYINHNSLTQKSHKAMQKEEGVYDIAEIFASILNKDFHWSGDGLS